MIVQMNAAEKKQMYISKKKNCQYEKLISELRSFFYSHSIIARRVILI